MRNIEVSAKTVDQAIEKGLQMLGVNREDIEFRVVSEGSMLKKAVVEIFTFANEQEREEDVMRIDSIYAWFRSLDDRRNEF